MTWCTVCVGGGGGIWGVCEQSVLFILLGFPTLIKYVVVCCCCETFDVQRVCVR